MNFKKQVSKGLTRICSVTEKLNGAANNLKEKNNKQNNYDYLNKKFKEESKFLVVQLLKLGKLPEEIPNEIQATYKNLQYYNNKKEEMFLEECKKRGFTYCGNCNNKLDLKQKYCTECGCVNMVFNSCWEIFSLFEDENSNAIPRDLILKDGTVLEKMVKVSAQSELGGAYFELCLQNRDGNYITVKSDDIKTIK